MFIYNKKIFKGHITSMSILMSFFSHFLLKLHYFRVYFYYFSHFQILFSLFLHLVFGKHKLGNSTYWENQIYQKNFELS